MKIKPHSYPLIGIMLLGIAVIIGSLSYTHLEAKLLPMIFGGLIFILAAIQLGRELLVKEELEKMVEQERSQLGLRSYRWAISWLLCCSLSVYLVGFLISSPSSSICISETISTSVSATTIPASGSTPVTLKWALPISLGRLMHSVVPLHTGND